MKLLPLLAAAVFPLLLTSCYTDGFGYVETGYYPRYYGHYGHAYHGPWHPRHYVVHHGGHHRGHHWRHHDHHRGHHRHHGDRHFRNAGISIGGWSPRVPYRHHRHRH